jgi:hypothetical protein
MFDKEFTPTALSHAVSDLFELNGYEVLGPIQVCGAEIDLKAISKYDPFASPIFIEVTIEYVDNEKYGKDVGKLALIAELDRSAIKLIVSSKGFSIPVKERAEATKIQTLTYWELFHKFENFAEYINSLSDKTRYGQELLELNNIYEEPYFKDARGEALATTYLTDWKKAPTPANNWIFIVGEYGTGKTALTKILQYRWIQDYIKDPSSPIPFRIELRDFTKQFDSKGLLHHFLDTNNLGNLSIDFVNSLIKSGRIILLLDGYDEMAQYLHVRERRSCLEALANLSAGGAKGILTSRPNYFTEAEELRIFETLYSSLEKGSYFLSKEDKKYLESEERLDNLLGNFLNKYERILKDLDEEQTERLVTRVLICDPEGKEVVLNLLKRIFRGIEGSEEISLSGKPVIISYLLDVVEGLKESEKKEALDQKISEWQIYKRIIDQLMMRDYRRSVYILPDERRRFLQRLAILLSRKGKSTIEEDEFAGLVEQFFKHKLDTVSSDSRQHEKERYFADLRSSSTLTRVDTPGLAGWRFSHNSLREYLVAEFLCAKLKLTEIPNEIIPISEPMKLFVRSLPKEEITNLAGCLGKRWSDRKHQRGAGQLLCLIIDAAARSWAGGECLIARALLNICGSPICLDNIEINRIVFSSQQKPENLAGAEFNYSVISEADFSSANLNESNFSNSIIENVNYSDTNLQNSRFEFATILDADFTNANLAGANFKGVASSSISIIIGVSSSGAFKTRLFGEEALGYLTYNGATTEVRSKRAIFRNHPKYSIVEKIVEKLNEQTLRQRRGLQQRGPARKNVKYATDFLAYLESNNIITTPRGRKDLVEVTDLGRQQMSVLTANGELPDFVCDYLSKTK